MRRTSLGVVHNRPVTFVLWSFTDTAGCAPCCRQQGGHPSPLLYCGGGIYLIPFATHALVHECQDSSSKLPSHLVFWLILTHFTATPAIPLASPCLEPFHLSSWPGVEPQDLTRDVKS